jgi:transcriptional regulator with XRE-family HTH domain
MSNSNGVRNGTEKNPYTKIGERIGQLRKQAGLKQEELGRAVGVTTQAVSRWECGGAPDIELLPAIADTLHVSVDELFGRTPVAQTDIKELFDRTLCGYPKKDRMKAACDLMWNIQKAVLRCEDSNIDRVAVSNILDAATQKNQRKTTQNRDAQNRDAQDQDVQSQKNEHDERNGHKKKEYSTAEDSDASISTSGLYIETDSGYMSYGFNDLDYIFLLSQPEKGFESVIKDADSLRRLFSLLVKPYCLEVIAALYAKKPNENVTGRLLAKELNAPETEVIAVLDELCKYHLIRNLEITDTNGKMHIYSYENSAEWVAFLTFASMLMYTENEARLAVNMRKQSAFSAPLGTNNLGASWNRREEDNERINLYRTGNE